MEFFLKLFGLQPFYFINRQTSRLSLLQSMWGITLVSVCVASGIWILTDYFNISTKKSSQAQTTTGMVVTICDIGTLALATVTCVIMASLRNQAISKLYSSLATADEKLNRYHNTPVGHFTKLKITWKISLMIIVFTLFLLLDFVLVVLIEQNNYFYICIYVFHYITFFAELQIVIIASRINFLFNLLNCQIVKCFKRSTIYHFLMPNNMPPVEVCPGTNTMSIIPVHYLTELSNIHWKLSKTVQEANEAFGLQLVALLLAIFAHLIITPYFFFLALSDPDTYGGRGPYLFLKFCWMALYSAQLCLLVAPCSSATDKANETAIVVCKFLNTGLTYDTKLQAESFLLQLLHHNSNFSACGLFNINLPVITSVAGAVTTYLVILIQFQKSDTDPEN